MAASGAVALCTAAILATTASPSLSSAAPTAAYRPTPVTRVARSAQAPKAPHTLARRARRAAPVPYAVHKGDTLSSIAQKQLGSAARWPALWWVNRNTVKNPNVITTSEQLSMPEHKLTGGWLMRRAKAAIPVIVQTVAKVVRGSAPAAPAAPSSSTHASPVGSAFEQCVGWAEGAWDPTAWYGHTDGTLPPAGYTGASGIFGDLLSTWDGLGLGYPAGAWSAPVSVQIQGFWKLYDEDGMSPWVADPCPAKFGY